MSNGYDSIDKLREENAALRQELDGIKSQQQDTRQKPIQGMMKLLKTKNQQIQDSVDKLEEANAQLRKGYEQTVKYYKNTITALSSAMEAKDPYFKFHSSQVESVSRKIADAISLSSDEITLLSTAALIHDFGNIGIRSAVLQKEGPLDDSEYEHVKTHPLVASIILEPIGDLGIVIEAVKYHHENFDGTGYPEGIQGENIPLFARILFIAESFDAITSPRPYRDPLPKDQAVNEISLHTGTRYDPQIVEAFQNIGI